MLFISCSYLDIQNGKASVYKQWLKGLYQVPARCQCIKTLSARPKMLARSYRTLIRTNDYTHLIFGEAFCFYSICEDRAWGKGILAS
jgi:hypothetical protein